MNQLALDQLMRSWQDMAFEAPSICTPKSCGEVASSSATSHTETATATQVPDSRVAHPIVGDTSGQAVFLEIAGVDGLLGL